MKQWHHDSCITAMNNTTHRTSKSTTACNCIFANTHTHVESSKKENNVHKMMKIKWLWLTTYWWLRLGLKQLQVAFPEWMKSLFTLSCISSYLRQGVFWYIALAKVRYWEETNLENYLWVYLSQVHLEVRRMAANRCTTAIWLWGNCWKQKWWPRSQ